jgi:hypothetical protein
MRVVDPQPSVSDTSTGSWPGWNSAGFSKVRPMSTVLMSLSSIASEDVMARGGCPSGRGAGSSSTCAMSSRVGVIANAVTWRWIESRSTCVSMWTKCDVIVSPNRLSTIMVPASCG